MRGREGRVLILQRSAQGVRFRRLQFMKTIILINDSQGPYLFSCQLEYCSSGFREAAGRTMCAPGEKSRVGLSQIDSPGRQWPGEKGSLRRSLKSARAAGKPQQILSSPYAVCCSLPDCPGLRFAARVPIYLRRIDQSFPLVRALTFATLPLPRAGQFAPRVASL